MTKEQKQQIRILYQHIKQAEQQVMYWSIEYGRHGDERSQNAAIESTRLLRFLHQDLAEIKSPPKVDVSQFADKGVEDFQKIYK